MRRIALLGLLALLPGCQFAGNPGDGFAGFLYDTHLPIWNPNRPPAEVENERIVVGQEVKVEALVPESGEVWPGPPAPLPTLQDVQKLNSLEMLPPPAVPETPPPPVFPQNAPLPQAAPTGPKMP
jgi:hypothetical protein